jgi:hypothetical protein
LYQHSAQASPKIPDVRDPERSVLNVREHGKREEPEFAGQHQLNVDTI